MTLGQFKHVPRRHLFFLVFDSALVVWARNRSRSLIIGHPRVLRANCVVGQRHNQNNNILRHVHDGMLVSLDNLQVHTKSSDASRRDATDIDWPTVGCDGGPRI